MPIDYEQLSFDFLKECKATLRRYYPILVDRAFGDASAVLGVDVAFDLDMPEVQEVLDQLLGAKSLQDIGHHLIETARDLIGRLAEEGLSVEELKRQLLDYGVTDSAIRAATIARTETASAYSRGALLAYEQSGVVSGSEWLVSDPCDICDPLAGAVADLGADFAAGIAHPPAHPNCRCAIAPVLK